MLQKAIDAVTWTKTTHIKLHEYVLQRDHPELFAMMQKAIEQDGYDAKFYHKTYRYLRLGDYKYWIVDNVLNRERIPGDL